MPQHENLPIYSSVPFWNNKRSLRKKLDDKHLHCTELGLICQMPLTSIYLHQQRHDVRRRDANTEGCHDPSSVHFGETHV